MSLVIEVPDYTRAKVSSHGAVDGSVKDESVGVNATVGSVSVGCGVSLLKYTVTED